MGSRELRLHKGTLVSAFLAVILICAMDRASAQAPGGGDQVIDSIRRRNDIGASDQRRIRRWVQDELGRFKDFESFRTRFKEQYGHANNSVEFKREFVLQTAEVATKNITRTDLRSGLTYSLAQVLLDLNRQETFSGLLAGLKSQRAETRYLCVRGLVNLRTAIAADDNLLRQAVQAIEIAGLAESDPVVLRRIYETLAFPTKVAAVVDTYLRLFDKRLAFRRGSAVVVDGAEYFAWEYFGSNAVQNALTDDQKVKLVAAIAVFVRLDAERYAASVLSFREKDLIERCLWVAEEALTGLVGATPGKIRDEISNGNPANVLQEAYKWTGNAQSNTPGALNQAPWNVPVGAP